VGRQGIWHRIFYELTGQTGVIGKIPDGRTIKIHALSDAFGRPSALLMSAGNIRNINPVAELFVLIPAPARLLAGRANDTNALRAWLAERGAEAVILSTRKRHKPIPHDRVAYVERNRIERLFCRLK
jgi:transposase